MTFNCKFNTITGLNPIEEFMCLNEPNNAKPFKKHWLNNAHLETLLPGSSWEKVYDLIIPELCQRLHTQFFREDSKQALFELLGKYFVSKYFPLDDPDPSITRPPALSTEESIKLYSDSKQWLDITIERILKERGIYDKKSKVVCAEMNNYIDQARHVFMSHFKKELSKREGEYFKKISTVKPNFRGSNSELHHKPQTAVSSVYDNELPHTIQTISPYGPEMMIAPLPHCISFQSEFIGESLVDLCQKNEEQIQKISKAMSGRRLPISLRKLIWKNVLIQSQSPVYDEEINFEELLMEKFSRAVTRGMTELKISKDIKSPVNELLENLIIEHYEKCASLHKYCDDVEFLSEAVKILNILYTYDRSYDPHLVFWLFPLHFGLKNDADFLPMNKIPFSYDIAMYLSLLHNVYPAWSDIFNMSERVYQRLVTADSELAVHISNVARNNVLSQPKDFLAQIMDMEINKAKLKRPPRTDSEDSYNDIQGFEVLKSPIIFIRKWIGEGFVSVLGSESVLFIFDQLFMEKFAVLVFEDACVALILLLKHRFLLTKDHQSMKTVFLDYPSSIFTVDFIRAWVWIHRGGNLGQVSNMNRREMHQSIPAKVLTPPPPKPTARQIIILPSIYFNDIRLKLIFPTSNDKEAALANAINSNMLSVTVSLYLGGPKIIELGTKTVPVLRSNLEESGKITKSYRYKIEEFIEFNSIDVTHLTDHFKEEDQLVIIASVLHAGPGDNTTTLGWCFLPCVIEEKGIIRRLSASIFMRPDEAVQPNYLMTYVSKLKIKKLRHEIPLYTGEVPVELISMGDYSHSGILMKGSMLGINSFNKPDDPPTPPDSPKVVEVPKSLTPSPPQKEETKPIIPEEEKPPAIVLKEDPVDPHKDNDAWIPFNPEAFERIKPQLSSRIEPFCLYIDQIRFLPDTCTIVKVTGRFFQTGFDENIPDVLIIPNVESDARSPTFMPSSRVVINENKSMNLSKTSILIIRVYTVLKTNLEVAVVGNVIVPIFDENENVLLSGCFQKRLRNQMPKVGVVNSSGINKNSLDNAQYVDCVSITFRLWPFTANTITAPEYSSGVYESSDCKPTRFEWDIYSLYKSDKLMLKDYRDIVKEIKYRDANPEFKDQPITHIFMLNYFPYRLDVMKFLPKDQVPQHIATELMFHYRVEKGIHVKVNNVYGLKDDKLLFVTTKVLRGFKTADTAPRPSLKYGVDEFQIFSNLDPKSPMTASKWRDSFQLIKPYFDDQALLVIQLWGISGTIKGGAFYDKISGKPINKLIKEHLVGWTAIQLFKHGFVNSGKHQLPLFNIRIHHALLKRFQSTSIIDVLQKEEEFKVLAPSSIIMYLFDGHRGIDEYPANQPTLTELIDNCPCGTAPFVSAMEATNSGKTVFQEVNEIIDNSELAGQSQESKSILFNKYFSELSKTLVVSVPPKQPHIPILF